MSNKKRKEKSVVKGFFLCCFVIVCLCVCFEFVVVVVVEKEKRKRKEKKRELKKEREKIIYFLQHIDSYILLIIFPYYSRKILFSFDSFFHLLNKSF